MAIRLFFFLGLGTWGLGLGTSFAQSCSCSSPTGPELVINGDFSAGNTGFTSQYSSLCTPGGMFSQVDVYCVGTDPSVYNPGFSSCSGHGGSGNFMIVNGGSTNGSVVWSETITVTPSTNYVFSTWIVSTATQSPGQLNFYINGVPLAGTIQAPSNTCNWVQFCTTWNSGASVSAIINITNINTAAFGNDYGLDDISFVACACTGTMTVSATSTNATCGSNNGSATANPNGGVTPYIYLWTGGQTTQTATGLGGGTYTVTVTDDNGCVVTAMVTVSTTPGPTATISSTNPLCNGSNDGTATANPGGGTSPYTYSWNTTPVQTDSIATGLPAGTYTVVITDISGCVGTQSVTLSEPAAITASAFTTPDTCGNSSGSATVSTSGGTGSFTYNWNPTSQTTQTATGLTGGTYDVTVTDANGCTQTATAVVTTTGGPTVNISSAINPSCNGGNNGSATANPSGGTSPYTYSWNTTPVQTDSLATGLSAGNYTVTVTDTNGCNAAATAVITEPPVLTVTVTCTAETVAGANDGTSSSSPSGGTVPYSYLWSNLQTTQNISSLPPGNYSVTVTDANLCTANSSCTVDTAISANCPVCTLPGFQYVKEITIDNSASSTSYTNFQELIITNTQTPISQGKMNASGNDIRFVDSDCSTPLCYFIESGINTANTNIWVLLPALADSSIKTIYMFYGNPSAGAANNFNCVFPSVLTVTGAVTLSGNQNYDWIDIQPAGNVTISTGTTLTFTARKIIMAGNINGNGAGYGAGAGPGAGTNGGGGVGGSGGSYGGVGGSGGGGTSSPYGTANGPDIDMGSGGGGSDCPATGEGGGAVAFYASVVNLTGTIYVNGNTANNCCCGNSSEAAAGGSGGGILIEGDYVSGSGSLNAQGGNGGDSDTKEGGGGGSGGRIKIFYCISNSFSGTTNVSGGAPGVGPQSGEQPGQPGTATTNTFPCETITFGSEQTITVANAGPDVAYCSGSSAVIGPASIPGYTYSWLPTTGLSNPNVSNPIVITTNNGSGNIVTNYVLTAMFNGCPAKDTVQVTVYPLPTSTFTATGPVCVEQASVILYTGNAAPGATYIWDFDSATVLSGSGQGPYLVSWDTSGTKTITLTVIQNGCISATTTIINTVNPPNSNAGPDVNFCSGSTVTIGIAPNTGYTYSWSPATGLSSDTAANPTITLTNTTGNPITTNYIVTTSFAGCSVEDTVAITVSPEPLSDAGTDTAFCSGNSAFIGTPNNPNYTYLWSPVSGLSSSTVSDPVITLTNSSAIPLVVPYIVTTTFTAYGCTSTDTVAITVFQIPVSLFTAPDSVCVGESATITYTGNATGSASYTWNFAGGNASPGSGQGPHIVDWTSAGIFTITLQVTENTCASTTTSSTIVVKSSPYSNAGADVAFCSGSSAVIGASIFPSYSYLWSPATGLSSSTVSNPTVTLTNSTNNIQTTNYIVTTTSFGCITSDTVQVTVYPIPVAGFSPPTAQCLENNSFSFSAGVTFLPAATFQWNFGVNASPQTDTAQNPGGIAFATSGAQIVSLTIVQYGCTSNMYVDSVIIYSMPQINIAVDSLMGCEPFTVNFFSNAISNGPSGYTWDFGDMVISGTYLDTISHTYSLPGTYNVSLIITSAENCTASDTGITVTVNPNPVAGFSIAPDNITNLNPVAEFTDESFSSIASWNWSFGDGSSLTVNSGSDSNVIHTYSDTGAYPVQLLVTNIFGCSDSTLQYVMIKPDYILFVPSAFSPNGDKYNEYFLPIGSGLDDKHFELFIYNRWGDLIYETEDLFGEYIGWDGRANGGSDIVPQGVYVWLIRTKDMNKKRHEHVGHVTIIR